MQNAMFPHMDDVRTALDPRAREIIVDDVRRVAVNGLLEVDQILIDGIDLPMTDLRPVVKQDPGKEPETVMIEMPIVTVSDLPGFGRCLIRSVLSNDGNWQLGSKVVVIGEWAEGPQERFVSSLDVDGVVAKKDQEIKKLSGQLADAPSKADLEARDKEIAALKAKLADQPVDTKPAKEPKPAKPAKADAAPIDKAAIVARAKELKINVIGKKPEKLLELIKAKEAEQGS